MTAEDQKDATASTEPTTTATTATSSTPEPPVIVDKRASRRAILDEPTDYSKNANRLSNVRWPVGEDPSDEGTSERDKDWVNVKLEVTENPPDEPHQLELLNRNGPELRMKCAHCDKPLVIGGSRTAKEILEGAGFTFKPYEIVKHAHDEVAACICENGHVTQMRMDFAQRLIKR